jgi:hypothetical protein
MVSPFMRRVRNRLNAVSGNTGCNCRFGNRARSRPNICEMFATRANTALVRIELRHEPSTASQICGHTRLHGPAQRHFRADTSGGRSILVVRPKVCGGCVVGGDTRYCCERLRKHPWTARTATLATVKVTSPAMFQTFVNVGSTANGFPCV